MFKATFKTVAKQESRGNESQSNDCNTKRQHKDHQEIKTGLIEVKGCQIQGYLHPVPEESEVKYEVAQSGSSSLQNNQSTDN